MTGGGSHNHPSAGIIYIKAILKKMKDGEIHYDVIGHKGLMLLMQSPIVLTTLYHFPLALHHSICFTSHTTSHYTCTFSPSPHAFHPLSHSPLKFPSPCHIWVLSCHSTLNNLNLKLNSKLHKPDGFEFPKFAR